jgi:hypothetical protein
MQRENDERFWNGNRVEMRFEHVKEISLTLHAVVKVPIVCIQQQQQK